MSPTDYIVPLISAGASLVGASKSRRSARHAASTRIQTTVADAQAAGINPLTALGATGHQGADASASHASAGAGFAGVSRALLHGQQQMQRQQIENKKLENDAMRLMIAKQHDSNTVRMASLGARSLPAEGHAFTPPVPTRPLGTLADPFPLFQHFRHPDTQQIYRLHHQILSESAFQQGIPAAMSTALLAQQKRPQNFMIAPKASQHLGARAVTNNFTWDDLRRIRDWRRDLAPTIPSLSDFFGSPPPSMNKPLGPRARRSWWNRQRPNRFKKSNPYWRQ